MWGDLCLRAANGHSVPFVKWEREREMQRGWWGNRASTWGRSPAQFRGRIPGQMLPSRAWDEWGESGWQWLASLVLATYSHSMAGSNAAVSKTDHWKESTVQHICGSLKRCLSSCSPWVQGMQTAVRRRLYCVLEFMRLLPFLSLPHPPPFLSWNCCYHVLSPHHLLLFSCRCRM